MDTTGDIIGDVKRVEETHSYKKSIEKFEGLQLRTTKQNIKILISSLQSCCEEFGMVVLIDGTLYTLGDIEELERRISGREITGISWSNSDLTSFIPDNDWYHLGLKISTNLGDVFVVGYNSECGYPHYFYTEYNNKKDIKVIYNECF